MRSLTEYDLFWCARGIPKPLAKLMKIAGPSMIVAGGYIRARVCGEDVGDIDVFASSKADAAKFSKELAMEVGVKDADIIRTANATTILASPVPIQFVHRWTFPNPTELLNSFDFTIARAAMWYESGAWKSAVDDRFYEDLAARRLVYSRPDNPEAGASMLRVLKFSRRGYGIPLDDLARIISRMLVSTGATGGNPDEPKMSELLIAKLREVDPSIAEEVDGHA